MLRTSQNLSLTGGQNARGVWKKITLITALLSSITVAQIHALTVTSEEISAYVQKRVIAHILKDPDITTKDIKIKVVPIKAGLDKIPSKATQYRVKIQEKATFGGSHILPLVFSDADGAEFYQLPIHLLVTVFGKVFKANTKIEQGSIIDESQISQYYESINGLPENRIRKLEDIVGYECRISLYEGNPITPYQIRRIPAIRSGQVISAKIQKQGFSMIIKVKAVESGYIGQRIKAKTLLDSGKMVEGIVINNETIEVNTLY